MKEAVLATVVFWAAFVYSIGAFWIATMEAAKDTTFGELYRNYFAYVAVGWLPQIVVIGLVVGTLGGFNQGILTFLYFAGAGVIFYLAFKAVVGREGGHAAFDFNWKAMTLLSWSNPKVWVSVPAGFLAATYTESLFVNIVIFFLIGLPMFVSGVYLWGMIGRHGARIAKGKLSYFNASLLAGFGAYLVYQGALLAASPDAPL